MIQHIKIFLTAALFPIAFSAAAQSKEVRFLLDTSIVIMQQNAAEKGEVNWRKLKRELLTQASGVDEPNKLGPVMRHLYQSVHDFHGSFFYKDSTFKWHRNEPVISDSLMNQWKKGVRIKTLLLDSNIGYLRMPSMPYPARKDADRNAQILNDSLCYLLDRNVKGIVLDLRLNGGGSMYPMMLGVEQLLGTGQVGSFPDKKTFGWYIKQNSFLLDTMVMTSISPKCNIDARDLPVVLLIGSGTGSSGEFLTMAFKGRKNTFFIGGETAGYVTSVAGFPINNDAYMYVSTGYGADRKGVIYKEAIRPDLLLNGPDSFNNVAGDEKVKAAIRWLRSRLN